MKKRRKTNYTLLAYQAFEALKEAVAEAIAEHKRKGIPIVVWKDGKVVSIPSEEIVVPKVRFGLRPKKKAR